MPDRPLRVAIWCAVSSPSQAADDKASLPDQEAAGRRFAESIGGTVVRVYTVPGHTRALIFWSEAEATMKAYRQLREDCEQHAFDVLHALDMDRLGRDPALSTQVVSLVEKSGAEVYLATAPHPVGHASTAMRYVHAIQSVRASEDSRLRVIRHGSGTRARVRRGLSPNHWPIGYRPIRDPTTGATIGAEIDPATAPIVEKITRMYLDGHSYGAICRRLNEAGHLTSTGNRRWALSSIWDMLQKDFYAGYPTWGPTRPDQPSTRYPPLWDEETHHAIIRERARRARNRSVAGPGSAFYGIAYCARCGRDLVRGTRAPGTDPRPTHFRWLRCATHAEHSYTGEWCHINWVYERAIAETVDAFLADLAGSLAQDVLPDQLVNSNNQATADLDRVTEQMDNLAHQRERLALALAAGQMDIAIYRSTDDRLLDQLHTLDEEGHRLRQLIAAAPDPANIRAALDALLDIGLVELIPTARPAQVRALLDTLGLRVAVEEGTIVGITICS